MKEEDYNMEDDGDSNVKIEFSSSEIKEEIKLTNQFGLLSCQECGKVMHTQKNLEEHLAFVHQGIVKYKCSYCQKGFERSNYLREHIKHTHLEKKFHCDVCDFKTSIKKRFETHKQTHTGEEVKKVPSEFKCPECEKLLPSQKFLEEHIAFVHQGIVKYKCSECDKGFERSHYLREHIKHSHLEKRFQCQTCDFKTSIKRRFETHVLSHTLPGDIKEKPKKTYQCDFCGYTSIKKQNFESHVRTHTGEKPYACDQCPLKFADKGYFKTHLKIHSGEIKVACEECGKMVNKNKMKYHIQSKHSGVSSKRSYEYPEEVKQMAVKLAAEIGVYKAAKTLNLKIHAVRKWKQGITEYQGTVQSEEDKLRCPTCLLILPSRYLLHRHRETVHFEKVEKRKIIKYPEHMRREIAQFALQYGQSAAREKYEVNESTLREWITFFHQPILCTECGLPFSYLRKLQNHMQTVHNMNFEPENQEMNLEVLKQRAEQAIELKQKAKEEAKLKQQKKMEIQQQLYQQHLMQQEMMKSMQLLKESNEEKCKNEGEGETESEQMEIKPEINVKEEVDYNEDEEEDFVEGYDDSFRNDDYDDSFRDDDDDNEEMKEKIEPWLVQMSALTILTITSLHQLHFGKFYRNRFLRKLFFKQEIELQPKTLKFVTTKPKKKKRTPNVKGEICSCEHCGKVFKYKYDYDRHIVVHTGEKNHICNTCGKAFAWWSTLQKHMKIHDGVRYPCHICGKEFTQKGNILKHYKAVHEDKSPENMHVCDECGKDFKCIENLKIHISNHHVDPAKKTCDVCRYTFSCITSLKKHTKKFQGMCLKVPATLTNNCVECGQYFEKRWNLKVHLKKVHNREVEYSCTLCSALFLSKNKLLLHIRTDH